MNKIRDRAFIDSSIGIFDALKEVMHIPKRSSSTA